MFFSVVIPTYNRLPILEKCLRALEQQTFDETLISGYEIVVVDDGSTDGTLAWLDGHCQGFPHVRTWEQDHQGPAAARNLGVKEAAGDTIIFIDSDLVVTDIFLQAHAEGLQRAKNNTIQTGFLPMGPWSIPVTLTLPNRNPTNSLIIPPPSLPLATWRSPSNGY